MSARPAERLSLFELDQHVVGGDGVDQFIFEDMDGWTSGSHDVIEDFELGTDSVVFAGMGVTAANVTITQSGTSALLAIDANSDGVIDAMIELYGVGGAFGYQNLVFE